MHSRDLKAMHSPNAGPMHARPAALFGPLPPGLDVRVAEHAMHRGQCVVALTYLFPGLAPADAAVTTANDLAVSAAMQARADVERVPEVAEIKAAEEKLRAAEGRVRDAQKRLEVLQAERKAAKDAGEFKRGLVTAIAEAEEELEVLATPVAAARAELDVARAALERARAAARHRAVKTRLRELDDCKAKMIKRAEEFAKWLAAEFLEITACENALRADLPTVSLPRPVRPDIDVPPPPDEEPDHAPAQFTKSAVREPAQAG